MATASPDGGGGGAALRFAPLDDGATPLERLRGDNEAALQRALAVAVDADSECTLVLPHRLTTLLTHVFPRGLAALSSVAECVELTDELDKIHCATVVYVMQPQVDDARAVATHVSLLRSTDQQTRAFVLLVLGKWTALCADVLDHAQLSDSFHIEQVEVGFVALDSDLVTLGRERCLYDCYVLGNKSVLEDVASSLQQLQQLYGSFEHIKYKGDLSAFVFEQLMEQESHLRKPSGARPESKSEGEAFIVKKRQKRSKSGTMNTLLMIDRHVDLASVLSTPLTLEALIDEHYDTSDGFATVPLAAGNGFAQSETKDHVLALNASDPIFQQVRGLNIQAVTSALNNEASAVKSKFDRFRTTSSTASTAEVHEFVKTVPQMKAKQEALEVLVSVVEAVQVATSARPFREQWQLERAIMDFDPDTDVDALFEEIEDLIFRHSPLLNVLRVLCMYSVVHDGVPRDALRKLKMQLLQTYGHELIFSFDNLERLGLLREVSAVISSANAALSGLLRNQPVSAFQEIATALKAIDVDVDPLNPKGMAFVTSGYAPLSCLLVEELLKSTSWGAIDAPLSRLDGQRAEVKMKTRKKKQADTKKTGQTPSAVGGGGESRVLVVCFIGGVTYMEIAALRWLAQFYPAYSILVATSNITNAHAFLQDTLERIPSTT